MLQKKWKSFLVFPMPKKLKKSWEKITDPFIRNLSAWYFLNITMPKRTRWEKRRWSPTRQPHMFHDYTLQEFVSVNPHDLLPQDIEPYKRRFIELFGQAEYDSDSGSDGSGNDGNDPDGSGNEGEGAAAGPPPLPPMRSPPRSPSPRPPRSPSPQRQDSPMLATGHSPPPEPFHMGFEQLLNRRKCPTSPVIPGPSGRTIAMIPVLPGNEAGIGSDSESTDTDTGTPEPLLPSLDVLEDLRLSPEPNPHSSPDEADDQVPSGTKKTKH